MNNTLVFADKKQYILKLLNKQYTIFLTKVVGKVSL